MNLKNQVLATSIPVKKARKKAAPRGLGRPGKAEKTYSALIESAVKVVGKLGYEGASIANITAQAKVAQGTFYNYFQSRQDLLDHLLPIMGKEMTEYIRIRMDPAAVGPEREKQRITLYFNFLAEHPSFHRLVNEAETLASKAHKIYFKHVSEGYLRSLRRSLERGEITGYTAEELEPIVYMLLSTRTYLAQRYAFGTKGAVKPVPPEVVETYVKFVTRALFK